MCVMCVCVCMCVCICSRVGGGRSGVVPASACDEEFSVAPEGLWLGGTRCSAGKVDFAPMEKLQGLGNHHHRRSLCQKGPRF